jgi:hypothetical protein
MILGPIKPLLVWQESIQSFFFNLPYNRAQFSSFGSLEEWAYFHAFSYLIFIVHRLRYTNKTFGLEILSEEVGTPEEVGAFRRGRCFQKR